MNEVILDCDLMRFPNSGLYYYCLNLGNHVQDHVAGNADIKIRHYIPRSEVNTFKYRINNIIERSFHRYYKPFLNQCRIWHAPFQSGRIIPDRRKYRHIKVLLTIHDLNSLHEGKPLKEQQKSIAHTQSMIDRSDAIVCVSEFCRNDVLKNCDVGNRPLYVIHNGTQRVLEPRPPLSSCRPSGPFMFGMGYVNRKKNYHVLLSLVKDSGMDLVIAGRLDETDYVESIRRGAIAMGIDHRVHLPGPISEEEKAWYLRNCTAFVHPSLAEGFGFPVVEAMQLGKPLFLSDRTSLPEIGGDLAFYFSSFEREYMRKIFHEGMQRYKRENMSDALINRSKLFDWQKNTKKYLEVYQTLL
ncbi:MAG: glycosyltransferase family 4 protein [Sphingobacteriales bacterium]|nr:glycosyltransferase family 4 protein [Sphingobacteriales bacterium]